MSSLEFNNIGCEAYFHYVVYSISDFYRVKGLLELFKNTFTITFPSYIEIQKPNFQHHCTIVESIIKTSFNSIINRYKYLKENNLKDVVLSKAVNLKKIEGETKNESDDIGTLKDPLCVKRKVLMNERKETKNKLNKVEENFKKNFKCQEKLEHYKKVLNFYNIFIDEIVELLEKYNGYLFYDANSLNHIEIIDKTKLEKQSKILIFCMTEAYFGSQLFKNDWNRAVSSQKQILVVFLEKIETCFEWQTEKTKILDLSSIEMDESKIFKSSLQLNERNEFDEILQSLGIKKNESEIFKSLELSKKNEFIALCDWIEHTTNRTFKIPEKGENVYLSYSKDDEKHAAKLIFNFEYFENSKMYLQNIYKKSKFIETYSDEHEVIKKEIENSKMILFLISNAYLDTSKFKNELEYAKLTGKIILPILVEDIINKTELIDLNEFKVTRLDDDNYQKFILLLSRALQFQINNMEQNLDYECVDLELKSIKIEGFDNIGIPKQIDIFENKILYPKKVEKCFGGSLDPNTIYHGFNIFDFKNGKITASIENSYYDFPLFFHLIHDSKVQIFYDGSSPESERIQTDVKLFDEQGRFVDKREWLSVYWDSFPNYTQSAYNPKNHKTYILNGMGIIIMDENFNTELIRKNFYASLIKVVGDYIITMSSNNVCLFDFELNLIISFKSIFSIDSLFVHPNYENLLFLCSEANIQILNLNNFTCAGFLNLPKSIPTIDTPKKNIQHFRMIINDKIVSINEDQEKFISKIETRKKNLNVDSRFICKLNQLDHHLYENPYFLPCGNSACLECIYDNFNIFRNTIKCNFQNCKEEHKLSNLLEKNSILNMEIINNLQLKEELVHDQKRCLEVCSNSTDEPKNEVKSQNQLEPEISTDRVNQASPVEMVDSDQNSSSSSYYNCDQNNEDFHFFLQHLELL